MVDGEVTDPASALGEHVNDCWPKLVGPSERSLVHWLRRLIFRGAWLDQRVKEGELDISYDEDSCGYLYIQPDRGGEPIGSRPSPAGTGSPTCAADPGALTPRRRAVSGSN